MIIKVIKPESEKKKKYPKVLEGDKEVESFEENKYYLVNMEFPKNNKTNIYLFIMITVVLSLCIIKLWPLWLKFFVYYVSLFMLCAMVIFSFGIFSFFLLIGKLFFLKFSILLNSLILLINLKISSN